MSTSQEIIGLFKLVSTLGNEDCVVSIFVKLLTWGEDVTFNKMATVIRSGPIKNHSYIRSVYEWQDWPNLCYLGRFFPLSLNHSAAYHHSLVIAKTIKIPHLNRICVIGLEKH